MRGLLLLVLILAGGCSSRSNLAAKYRIPESVKLATVPFVKQDDFQCGPASISMMLGHHGKQVPAKELRAQSFTPGKKGSLQSDVITAIRRQRFIPASVTTFENLLLELHAGNPVLILQNLGLAWVPRWHYAVAVGYDLQESELLLHTGPDSFKSMSFFTFQKTWKRSENWGLLVLKPGQLPVSVSEVELLKSTAHLEKLSFLDEARLSYESILKKWPGSLGALIGLGNIAFNKKDFKASVQFLRTATELHPDSAEAWHNYSLALSAYQKPKEASAAAKKAVSLADENLLYIFTKSLADLLK